MATERVFLGLDRPAIEVAAEGRIVRIAGKVSSDDLKARCELVAWRVPGIEGVQNALAVSA